MKRLFIRSYQFDHADVSYDVDLYSVGMSYTVKVTTTDDNGHGTVTSKTYRKYVNALAYIESLRTGVPNAL